MTPAEQFVQQAGTLAARLGLSHVVAVRDPATGKLVSSVKGFGAVLLAVKDERTAEVIMSQGAAAEVGEAVAEKLGLARDEIAWG